MKIIGVIPARYASSRFPAKVLAKINGKPIIQWVYERAKKAKSLSKVVVATDHLKVKEAVEAFGGEVVMTKTEHPSGTDRCFEALQQQREQYDFLINIQGDEPFIQPKQIDILADCLQDKNTQIATLINPISEQEDLFNKNVVKVVYNQSKKAIYFSRHPIPYLRNHPHDEWLKQHIFYRHIGIYAYRTDVLDALTNLEPSWLERCESLEQLRWLENEYSIHVAVSPYHSMGIDTPEDLEKAIDFLAKGVE
jgi:3-deoxy-manno-octulosonate cytidylyltransferase (CMP-KDO synthetase)